MPKGKNHVCHSPRGGGARQPHNFAVAYLNVLVDDADQEELTAALGRIARRQNFEAARRQTVKQEV